MKKQSYLIFVIMIALMLALAFTSGAQDTEAESSTYYVVQNSTSELAHNLSSEGKNVVQVADLYSSTTDVGFFDSFADGASIELVLAENISYSPSGAVKDNTKSIYMCLNNAVNVTVRFSGYTWHISSSNVHAGWRLANKNAKLTLIGTKGTNEDGKAAVTDASLYNSNELNTDLDFFGGYIGVYIFNGNVSFENLRMVTYEDCVYQKASDSGTYLYTFNNSSVACKNPGSQTYAIHLQTGNGHYKTIQVENCYITSGSFVNPTADSYFKNVEFYGASNGISFYTDSWLGRNNADLIFENVTLAGSFKTDADGIVLKATNCTFNGDLILKGDNSGGASAELVDCIFNGTANFATTNQAPVGGQLTEITTSKVCGVSGSCVVSSIDGIVSETEILPEYTEHDIKITVVYSNGFSNEGKKTEACSRCSACTTEVLDALFTFRGFSCAEYADGGMTIGFNVNNAAITEYEAITGETVNYGVFAVLAETIGKNDIFDGEGKALNGVIAADITNGGFDIFNLKIVGFTSEQAGIKLAMGAFVATTLDGVTEYSYMQGEAPNENEKYFFASYEDIYATLKSKETVTK